jgi:hypothetical protein
VPHPDGIIRLQGAAAGLAAMNRHSGRAERGPESITTVGNELRGLRLWIPGSRLRRAPE